ncbi:unnamed protein product [Owenia fusiformis]|uniref:Uncharacterized protein n=1 Tax=Owenia fusiformis TaxID=6347 RepID=A0A8J1TEC6_OWEFU|nr:unnamed protein product [Owenia fusiformis]
MMKNLDKQRENTTETKISETRSGKIDTVISEDRIGNYFYRVLNTQPTGLKKSVMENRDMEKQLMESIDQLDTERSRIMMKFDKEREAIRARLKDMAIGSNSKRNDSMSAPTAADKPDGYEDTSIEDINILSLKDTKDDTRLSALRQKLKSKQAKSLENLYVQREDSGIAPLILNRHKSLESLMSSTSHDKLPFQRGNQIPLKFSPRNRQTQKGGKLPPIMKMNLRGSFDQLDSIIESDDEIDVPRRRAISFGAVEGGIKRPRRRLIIPDIIVQDFEALAPDDEKSRSLDDVQILPKTNIHRMGTNKINMTSSTWQNEKDDNATSTTSPTFNRNSSTPTLPPINANSAMAENESKRSHNTQFSNDDTIKMPP